MLKKADVERFIRLLPDWDSLADGLEGIVLMPGNPDYEGMSFETWIGVFAWSRGLWQRYDKAYLDHPRESIMRLGVPMVSDGAGAIIGKWTEDTVRAYQLLDVFLHELGHHHDQMTTRSQAYPARGESYAEAYAKRYGQRIWIDYIEEFGLVLEDPR